MALYILTMKRNAATGISTTDGRTTAFAAPYFNGTENNCAESGRISQRQAAKEL